MRKIYDGFLFYNELDLLEIRLNVLNDVVDHFILIESSVTHSGQPKSFIFEDSIIKSPVTILRLPKSFKLL